ncbi:Hypp2169 [Branchiostoma lanceolatum]|uniref:Hypp2169 protein n=1 Tax=Branchiostoma lanceolatum TaxID=7740 RepID=A0A8J9ZS38_BRALA|nr:Hypp2169 [Branchiostoma lanceolatum]
MPLAGSTPSAETQVPLFLLYFLRSRAYDPPVGLSFSDRWERKGRKDNFTILPGNWPRRGTEAEWKEGKPAEERAPAGVDRTRSHSLTPNFFPPLQGWKGARRVRSGEEARVTIKAGKVVQE